MMTNDLYHGEEMIIVLYTMVRSEMTRFISTRGEGCQVQVMINRVTSRLTLI